VLEMETRLSGGDVALEPQTDDGEESFAPIAYLADESSEPTRVLEAQRRETRYLRQCYETPEHKEAVQAFLQKRKPNFR